MVRWKRVAKISAAIAAALVVVGGAVVFDFISGIARSNLSNQEFSRAHLETPATLGLAYEDIVIPSDGLELAGWWIPGPSGNSSGLTVVIVHGLGANMSKTVNQWAGNLHAAGHHVLAFDLRNHGASPEVPSRRVTFGADESLDVLAAVDFVQMHAAELGADANRIALYGESMGGAAAVVAGATRPEGVVAVLSDSAFASLEFQAHIDGKEKGYPRFVVDWVLARMDHLAPSPPSSRSADRAIREVEIPLFLAHCKEDSRVQPASFERLSLLAPDATTWYDSCLGGPSIFDHVDGWTRPDYNATVRAFLAPL